MTLASIIRILSPGTGKWDVANFGNSPSCRRFVDNSSWATQLARWTAPGNTGIRTDPTTPPRSCRVVMSTGLMRLPRSADKPARSGTDKLCVPENYRSSIDIQLCYPYVGSYDIRVTMMITVNVSPKFQIVIPKESRRNLKLKAGQKLQIFQIGDRLELLPLRKYRKPGGC